MCIRDSCTAVLTIHGGDAIVYHIKICRASNYNVIISILIKIGGGHLSGVDMQTNWKRLYELERNKKRGEKEGDTIVK